VVKFYDYGIEAQVLTYSPVASVRRPKVSGDSSTVGLSAQELVRLLEAADAHSPRSSALVTLLAYNSFRGGAGAAGSPWPRCCDRSAAVPSDVTEGLAGSAGARFPARCRRGG